LLEYFLYQDSDDILRFISKLTRINEVIIDYSGRLGPGFSTFLTQSGFKLTKLSLSLQKFSFLDMKLISQECNRLKIFHIFFTNYSNNSNNCAKHALQMNHLEVLYLGVSKNCDSDLVHKYLTSNILNYCPNIQSLYLSGVSKLFCDSFLGSLLQKNCLNYLETFIVKQNCQLSKISLENLRQNCKYLRKIDLSSWNLSNEELKTINIG